MVSVNSYHKGIKRKFNLEIPLPGSKIVDLISGPFSVKVKTIWESHVVEYLTASDFRRHVWHSWLAGNPDSEPDFRILDFFRYSKSKDIIADAYGSCPHGYLPALRRLGATAREPRTYQSLFKVLSAGGKGAKLVHHAKEIDDDTIFHLASIPDDEFSTAIVAHLFDRSVDAEKFHGAVWVAARLGSMFGTEPVLDAVARSASPMKALRELVLQLPFPAPPLECRLPMVPVKSVKEVRALSRQFRNCLMDIGTLSEMAFAIQSGHQYLYHYDDGDSSALILIERFASVGWVIHEAHGIGNRRLSQDTMCQIEGQLGGEGDLCLAWPLEMTIPTRGWFFE